MSPLNCAAAQMVKIVLIFSALCLATSAFAFNVGPYRLGMSNAEAKKVGFDQCKMDHFNQVQCVPTGFLGVSNIKKAGIWFDGGTGAVTSIQVTVWHEGWPEGDVYKAAMEQLKISRCQAGWNGSGEDYLGWCYSRPNHVRLVERSKSNFRKSYWYSIDVSAKTDPKHVESFIRSKEKKAAQDALVKRISDGK